MPSPAAVALVALVVAGGCRADPEAAAAPIVAFARPDPATLLHPVAARGTPKHEELLRLMHADRRSEAATAMWAAIAALERDGLRELFGFESFQLPGGNYRALFFVRTAKGRQVALFADRDYQEAFRLGSNSVPFRPVDDDAWKRLRRRVVAELPLESTTTDPNAEPGGMTILHVHVDGRSSAAVWPRGFIQISTDREDLERLQEDFTLLTVFHALWGSVPLDLFPDAETAHDEVYGKLPGLPASPRSRRDVAD